VFQIVFQLSGTANVRKGEDAMTETTEAYDWQGRTIVGSDGEKIGKVSEVYVDERTGKPEWATVNTGLFGKKSHFVPLAGASVTGEDVRVHVDKDEVKDAPSIDPDGELSQQEEARLFEHYGVPYTDEGSVTAEGAPRDRGEGEGRSDRGEGERRSERGGDEAMTRSEEELRVGTERVETGRVRLRKHVVTEMVTKTVPVSREEVHVEREPITDANREEALDGPEISEDEHEVVLHEERPVVEKQVVPKERVRLDTETSEGEQEISEEVRKEQIDVDEGQRR
jgi:uncharacterized protein (TIGR02271 family)